MAALTCTTELEAVNTMLKAIGEVPVNTLEITGLTDAAIARDILAEISREVQTVGWFFNTDLGYTFTPDANGQVVIPENVLSVLPSKGAESRPIIPRGGNLYDRNAQSDVFDTDTAPVMDVKWLFDFETLPETFRRFITVRAARIFQDRVQGAESIHSFNMRDEQDARLAVVLEEDSFTTANSLSDTQDATDIWSR